MRHPQVAENIFTIEDFPTRAECLQALVRNEESGYELARVSTASGSQIKTDVRNNSRVFLNSEQGVKYVLRPGVMYHTETPARPAFRCLVT